MAVAEPIFKKPEVTQHGPVIIPCVEYYAN
jgi:hypothetical protein